MQHNYHIISTLNSDFEDSYISIRNKENRVYSDKEVAQLPNSTKQANEWNLRKKSAKRFVEYLSKNHSKSTLLEIGSGNGWFTHLCSQQVKHACGVDLNHTELEQAARVFPKENLHFYYWDLFTESPFDFRFDIIVLNAVVQYFPNFNLLLNRLKDLLNPNGEIHFVDSPFYLNNDISAAQQRTKDYYTKMGVPEMSKYYFHHNLNSVKDFDVLYKPNKVKQLLKGKDSPFCWYKLRS